MPRHDPIATVYAQALLEASGGAVGQVDPAFESLADTWRRLPEFRAFLTAPGIPDAEKRKVLAQAFDGAPRAFLDFLGLVIDKGRVTSLPAVHAAFRDLRDDALGRVRIQAQTASALTPEQSTRVEADLKGKLKREVVLEPSVKPEVLGGIRLQMGDWVVDGTLQRRLRDLARRVELAPLPTNAWGT